MILTILKIRLIQLFRLVKEIGLLRIAVLLSVLAFIALLIIQTARQPEKSYIISIITGLILLSIHVSRKDKQFLRIICNESYFVFLTEYFVLVAPLIVIGFIFKNSYNALILSLTCIIISAIPVKPGSIFPFLKILLNPFSVENGIRLNIRVPVKNPLSFEWISGLRKHAVIFVPAYLLIFAFSFKAFVAPAGMIIVSILTSGFYYYGEPREFIELFSLNYSNFILQKIKLSITYLFVLFMPLIIISSIFQPATWYYIAGATIIALFIHIFTIIFKYALFAENADLGRNSVIIFITIVCILLPFLWPFPIIMGIKYYSKADNNIKKYSNDLH